MSDTFKKRVTAAEAEARRFLDRVRAWRLNGVQDGFVTGCKHRGAIKRASMDLSRSLAEVRKGERE